MDELLKNNLNFNTSYKSLWSLVEPFIKHLFSVFVCRWCSLELNRLCSLLSALPQLWLPAWRTAVQHLYLFSVMRFLKILRCRGQPYLCQLFPSHLSWIQIKQSKKKNMSCLSLYPWLGLATVAISFQEYCSNPQVFLDHNHLCTLSRLWLLKWSLP